MAILRVLEIKECKSDLEILRKTSKSHRVKTRILFLLMKQSKQKMSQE
jgi:hypothetical protein